MATMLTQAYTGRRGRRGNMRARFDFNDAPALAFDMDSLPVGTVITAIHRKVLEAFNSATSDLLEIGDSVDPNRFTVSGETTLTGVGDYSAMTGVDAPPHQLTAAVQPRLTYASTGAAPTTGKCEVTFLYALADTLG